jgi:predicted membrane-bound mannosyltransferase
VPMFAIPAAVELARLSRDKRSAAPLAIILALNAAQALMYNLLFWTKF